MVERIIFQVFLACAFAFCCGADASDDLATCPASDPRIAGQWMQGPASFEHADSGRTHLFRTIPEPRASELAGADVETSHTDGLPGVYNLATGSSGELYALGGVTRGGGGAPGPFVAKIDTSDMSILWRTDLLASMALGEWNYPGVIGVHANGHIYAVYGYRLAKLDRDTGSILDIAVLPTNQPPRDTAYNGFTAASDGTLILKSHHRKPGCETDGFQAVIRCGTDGTAPSVIAAVDPDTMEIRSYIEAEELIGGRISATPGRNGDEIYAPGIDRLYRFIYRDGKLRRDREWGPITYRGEGQTPATAAAVMNDWVILQSNALPATTPLTLLAVSRHDGSGQVRLQPFADRPRSMIPSMPSVDPDANIVFIVDGLAGSIGAYRLGPDGAFEEAWRDNQKSFSFSILVGSKGDRVLISTDAIDAESFDYDREQVVWRDAGSGAELARSPIVGRLGGAVMAPNCAGVVYYPATTEGRVYKFKVTAAVD